MHKYYSKKKINKKKLTTDTKVAAFKDSGPSELELG